jgi:hypothetical protein
MRATPLLALAATLFAPAARGQEEPEAGPPAQDAAEAPAPLLRAGPDAGDFRWELAIAFGPSGGGGPNVLVGGGAALGTFRGVRVEANAFLGWSLSSRDVPARASWNDDFWTFTGATATGRSVLLELSGSWKAGPLELRAGGGAHVSMVQFDARYDVTRCRDFLCFDTYRTSDTDAKVGSGGVGLLATAGVRLALIDPLLLGLDVRWLQPATSRVGDRYDVSERLGGLAVSAGVTWRFGARVPR